MAVPLLPQPGRQTEQSLSDAAGASDDVVDPAGQEAQAAVPPAPHEPARIVVIERSVDDESAPTWCWSAPSAMPTQPAASMGLNTTEAVKFTQLGSVHAADEKRLQHKPAGSPAGHCLAVATATTSQPGFAKQLEPLVAPVSAVVMPSPHASQGLRTKHHAQSICGREVKYDAAGQTLQYWH